MKTLEGHWHIHVLDAGHRYKLPSLDGRHEQELQFVKRCDLANPERFPGNTNAYPGCTLQMVLRVLIDRVRYLQNQIWCAENWAIIKLLQSVIWLLEFRAARRHGRSYWHGLKFAETQLLCPECGHTVCEHQTKPGVLTVRV